MQKGRFDYIVGIITLEFNFIDFWANCLGTTLRMQIAWTSSSCAVHLADHTACHKHHPSLSCLAMVPICCISLPLVCPTLGPRHQHIREVKISLRPWQRVREGNFNVLTIIIACVLPGFLFVIVVVDNKIEAMSCSSLCAQKRNENDSDISLSFSLWNLNLLTETSRHKFTCVDPYQHQIISRYSCLTWISLSHPQLYLLNYRIIGTPVYLKLYCFPI